LAGLLCLTCLIPSNQVLCQELPPDRPGVPYFEIVDGNSGEIMPLKSTAATVEIAGVIAYVTVKQVYQNRGKNPIEAVYVFPGSARAAVHAMQMKIGERTIVAKIEEREKARNDYTRAINNGQSASLLEQQRPNVFQMNVGNIMPGDVVQVELMYTESLVPREGIYEFVYPTVVGPRYTGNGGNENQLPEWNANPFLPEGQPPSYTFSLDCNIRSGIPLQHVRCTSHKATIGYHDKKSVSVHLEERDLQGGNRDFILQYRLGGNGIESGLWLYTDGKEQYFMATIQPPEQVKPEMIPPREYIFIVDVSGSMSGFPLSISKSLITDLLGSLRSTDRFNILFFAGGSNLFAENSVAPTSENIRKAIKMLDSQSGGGGTELMPALKRALAMNSSSDFARSFVIATDGYVTVEKEAFELVKSNLNKASFFAFGIGSSVNRYLIEGLAHAGAGEPFIITSQKEAKVRAGEFRKYISSPVLTNVHITYQGFDVYDVEPSSVPDIFVSRPVVVFGKYRGKPSGKIILEGINGSGNYSASIAVAGVGPEKENEALKYLWAREQIRMIDDYAGGYSGVPGQVRNQVTKLGLEYNLLTAYTSFVAIDNQVRNPDGKFTTVRQPLPLPEGVSQYAEGSSPVGLSGSSMKKTKSLGYIISRSEMAVEEDVTVEETEIFNVVETSPEFPGGEKALKQYLKSNLKYPEEAFRNQVSGRVAVQFIVNADGIISDVKVMKSLGFGCDEEAIRLIKEMPAWIPGSQDGRPVKTVMNVLIYFSPE